jgi:dinuclear metal center YbgI/SA1388 family protein
LKIKDILSAIEAVAPVGLQESWDNSGLLVGNKEAEIDSALITIDVTEAVVDEAIAHQNGLIIAHHPPIFSGLKRITGSTETERLVMKAIQHNIAIYVAHTNIDVIKEGVSWCMAQKLGLKNVETLVPQGGLLKKLVVFVPENYADAVRNAVFEAGAGQIGNYDSCSFSSPGSGSFKGNDSTHPFVGEPGILHFENEVRVETIFPAYLQTTIISSMLAAHPYEEVAYDIYPLDNKHQQIGLGVVGELQEEVSTLEFLQHVKKTFRCEAIRHTPIVKETVKKVALVGGAGSSFLKNAIQSKADVFVTGDFKYHQFFDAEKRIVIADIGHYESEQFTKELFYEIVTNKFSKFALRLSEVQTNPVKYLF